MNFCISPFSYKDAIIIYEMKSDEGVVSVQIDTKKRLTIKRRKSK